MKKLSDTKTRDILKRSGIPLVRQALVRSEDEAAACARKTGYPVVLKVSSPDVIHKTDVGGILTDLGNEEEMRDAYRKIMASVKRKMPKARIDGMIVQDMIHTGSRELIVGARKDPQFGPVIMFGLGGVWVEALKDVSFRLVPIKRKDAREMISGIRGYSILKGMRGQKPVNFRLLEDCLLNVSRMIEKNSRIQELDINPLFVNDKRAVAVDARIMV
jgi:acyl-CoA synthetase (NDP forming)